VFLKYPPNTGKNTVGAADGNQPARERERETETERDGASLLFCVRAETLVIRSGQQDSALGVGSLVVVVVVVVCVCVHDIGLFFFWGKK
jgi:hypothetical protein